MRKTLCKPVVGLVALVLVVFGSAVIARRFSDRWSSPQQFNFYVTRDTLPTLYAALHAWTTTDPGYFWFQRAGTLDIQKLPRNISMLAPPGVPGDERQGAICAPIAQLVAERIKYLNHKYPAAKFNLFVDDYWWSLALTTLVANKLPESRYSVKILTGGDNSTLFGMIYEYRGAINRWRQAKTELKALLSQLGRGDRDLVKQIDQFRDYRIDLPFIFAQQRNVEYWMQFPKSIRSQDPAVSLELEKSNVVKKRLDRMYAALSPEQRASFLEAMGVDPSLLTQPNAPDAKPYLLITGTNPIEGALGGSGFKNVLEQVLNKYGLDYTLLFKPHPNAMPTEENGYVRYFSEKGIRVLSARMPIEVLLLANPKLKLGGFPSSLYLAVADKNIQFLILRDFSELRPAFKYMADIGYFRHVELLQPR